MNSVMWVAKEIRNMVEAFAISYAVHFSFISDRPKLSFFMEDSSWWGIFLNSPVNKLLVRNCSAYAGEKFTFIDRFRQEVICASFDASHPVFYCSKGGH